MRSTVTTRLADGVAIVTLDNPPVNALDEATIEALGEAARELAADSAVRAVVLTAAGERAFAVGADLREFAKHLGDRSRMAEHTDLTARVFGAWAALEVPVVAALPGDAIGGGLELALVTDFLVADPGAKLGVPETRLGLIPGAGATQRLPRRVGPAAAARLVLTGELIEASRAAELGLVDVVSAEGEALDEALALARRMAASSTVAVRAAKRALRAAVEEPLARGLVVERELFVSVASSPDAVEGATAFLEKRAPRFTGA